MPENPNKMFDSTKTAFWLQEIKSSEERKTAEMMKRNSYPDVVQFYEGEIKSTASYTTGEPKKRLAYINDYFPNTNALIAETVYQNPDIILTATKPTARNARMEEVDVEGNTETLKSGMNYGFKKTDAILENRIALFDMMYAGICFVEVDHAREKKDRQAQKPRTLMDRILKRNQTQEEIEKERSESEPPQEKGYSMHEETYIRRWNPLLCGLDYRAERVKDVRFVYKIFKIPYAEFIAQYPDYENKVHADAGDVPFSLHKHEQYRRMVLYYEVQHFLKNGIVENFIIAPSYPHEEIDYWLRSYDTNGFNLKIGVLDAYGRLYPKSRAAVVYPNHADKSEYMTFMMEVAERSIPRIGYNKDKVKEDGKRGLESKKVGALVPTTGDRNSVWNIEAPKVSVENKELIAMMEAQTERLWGVSKSRIAGKSEAEFATDIEIQEAGFQERRIDLQEGLRRLIRAELDTLKDIIVSFWDYPIWFKITGGSKPTWYEPQIDPNTGIVLNPLTDILTADYEVDVDITSMRMPNKNQKRKETVDYLTWLINSVYPILLQPQGYTINVDEIKKSAKEFGFNPENLIVQLQQPEIASETPIETTLPAGGA
jgi:hypothetical protein